MTTSLDTSEIRGIPVNANRTLSLSVLSGKGGVGKTTIALNLSLALRREGARVLLVDCDLGLANLDVLLGISPEVTLQDVLISDVSASAAVHRVEDGLDILPAASGVPELVYMTTDMRDMLLSRLRPLLGSYDYVFLDLGAGINGTVQTFADMSMARVLVVTPEPTAMTDTYAIIKVLAQVHGVRDFLLVVNQTESREEETATFRRLHSACKRFLGVEPMLLGGIRQDPKVAEAICRRKPLLQLFPACNAAGDLVELAKRLMRSREAMSDALEKRAVLEPSSL